MGDTAEMVDVELLERDTFLDTLNQHQLQTSSGGGRLVFIGGEAGVGKTSLIASFLASLPAGVTILRGACDPLSTPRPLGPLADIAAAAGRDFEQLLWSNAPRERVFHAFLALLQTADAPTIVVIEDVHWADDATLDLLRFIGRRVTGTHALMLATWRDDEVGPRHPLRVVLGDLATSGNISRLHLPPLSPTAVRTLAEGSDVDPDDLHRQTGGNPFFVTEVLAAGGQGIPSTVRDAVLARSSRLTEPARQTLDVAAVIGSVSESWLVAKITDAADEHHVEECVSAGVLRADEHGFSFRHELARQAILDTLTPHRRADLNRRVLSALRVAADGTDLSARLAHYADEAGDSAAVLEFAPAAARRAASLSAHREAAAQYERALRHSDAADPVERALLRERYAEEAYLTGRIDIAIEHRQEALAFWRRIGNRLKAGENLASLSAQMVFAGRNAEAEVASKAAIKVLESLPEPTRELGRAYRMQSFLRMLDRDTDDALSWGMRAIELAERFEDVETLAHVNNSIGSALIVADRLEGIAYLQRALEISRANGLHAQVTGAYGNLGSALGEVHQFAIAEPYLHTGIEYAAEHDLDYARLYGAAWLSLCHLYRARWNEVAMLALDIVRQQSAATISRIMALLALGRLRARRGDPDVWAALDEALALADATGTLQRLGPVRAARAEAAWLAGDMDRVRDEAEAAWDLAASKRHAWIAGELACWLWRAGATINSLGWTAEPFRFQIAGDWADAARIWHERGCPYEEALALSEGDIDALRQALEIFERLGARPMAAIVARRLREQGARGIPRGPRATTLANPANLTRRELEVLGLIAEGLRNSEIAERLFLAPKTVDHHVSAVLAKLGVHSRIEAAREAARLNLTPPS